MRERLTAEQYRALALLAHAGRDGMTQPVLTTLGFDASVTAGLVNEGLATQTLSRGRTGGHTKVVRIRIKAAGRKAIKG
jgi:glutamine phosphoribosylpyrophosphate amidotransferase